MITKLENTDIPTGSTPEIALLTETSTSWGREVVEGVGGYVRNHRPWHLFLRPQGMEEKAELPSDWNGQGIIARVTSLALARSLEAFHVPVVNISGINISGVEFPRVVPDETAVAQTGVQHLRELGLNELGYYVDPARKSARQRNAIFSAEIKRLGLSCHTFAIPDSSERQDWRAKRERLAAWLKELPKPVGIMAWGDVEARDVADACMKTGILVPEEVAILGIDSDRLINTMNNPVLSGIDLPTRRQGYLAARLLDRLMSGEPPKHTEILLKPLGVNVRASTDIQAIVNPHVRKAMNYIRENARSGITVKDVLEHVPMSRRTLERHFLDVLGRTPAAEIRRFRLETARRLLEESDMPISEVASASGWRYVEHLIPLFKRHYGFTPLQYRKHIRVR